ncbi:MULTISPECIES: transposase [unclassified Kitasatospora]|uniref:transposase n=1 Tax=unclassified Kitasatospora TaxID=2633591 RepID=UPI001F43BED8|nr:MULTISPECIES: transposase [unclassified Kitasatospora]
MATACSGGLVRRLREGGGRLWSLPSGARRGSWWSGGRCLRTHLVAPLREFIEANTDWLTVFQLPTYAPDLNPQEGIWSLVKRDIGNLAAADLGQVTRAVKRKLKMLQYRPEVIDGCLRGTGLTLPA